MVSPSAISPYIIIIICAPYQKWTDRIPRLTAHIKTQTDRIWTNMRDMRPQTLVKPRILITQSLYLFNNIF